MIGEEEGIEIMKEKRKAEEQKGAFLDMRRKERKRKERKRKEKKEENENV